MFQAQACLFFGLKGRMRIQITDIICARTAPQVVGCSISGHRKWRPVRAQKLIGKACAALGGAGGLQAGALGLGHMGALHGHPATTQTLGPSPPLPAQPGASGGCCPPAVPHYSNATAALQQCCSCTTARGGGGAYSKGVQITVQLTGLGHTGRNAARVQQGGSESPPIEWHVNHMYGV